MNAKRKRNKNMGAIGVGVDQYGGTLIDPTTNVINLVHAANARQDDLREAYAALNTARVSALADQVTRAEDHAREVGAIRAAHNVEIHTSEQERLRTIREIDVAALNNLSNTVVSGIESLRAALTSTAARIEAANTERANALSDRVTQLERTSYEGKGREAVSDPMLNQFMVEVKKLSEGKAGISMTWAIVIGAAAIFASVSGIFSAFRTPVTTPPPQVVYVPAPPGSLIPSPSSPATR